MIYRVRQPATVQFRCMVFDSFTGGLWIAFIAASTVPSALFAALLGCSDSAWPGGRSAFPINPSPRSARSC
ncbi:MASE2 domain-containing protein [Stenotrophomonas maltophilia]|uniref:MASE2 domain-containing protein n=1 Tax=Stenotrophomonas maltophilia TaxID=40324 RepID=UPI003323D182